MSVSQTRLKQLLQSDQDLSNVSLATRIVVGRLRIELQNEPGQIDAKMRELASFVTENDYAAAELAAI